MTDERPHCQEQIRWEATDYGMLPVKCGQRVGVTTWTDEAGLEHSACAIHLAGMQYRWTPESPLLARAADGDR